MIYPQFVINGVKSFGLNLAVNPTGTITNIIWHSFIITRNFTRLVIGAMLSVTVAIAVTLYLYLNFAIPYLQVGIGRPQ